jgi:hypothetical protein
MSLAGELSVSDSLEVQLASQRNIFKGGRFHVKMANSGPRGYGIEEPPCPLN